MGVIAVDVGEAQSGPVVIPTRGSRPAYRSWLRELHDLPDSLLHATRRRAAHAQLRDFTPRSILFICHGNICRSPFAAAAFVRACPPDLRPSIQVASAGFIGPDRSPPGKALASGSKYGIDMSQHRSALVTPERLQRADLVVTMSMDQARGVEARGTAWARSALVLGDLDPLPIQQRTIADPWSGDDAAFDASYARIDRCVRELARLIA